MHRSKARRTLLTAGLILITLGLLTGIIAPAFGPPRRTGLSPEQRTQQDVAARRFTVRLVGAFCLLVGAGSVLVISGLLLRAKSER